VLDLNEYARLVGPGGALPNADSKFVEAAGMYSAAIWSSLSAAGVNFVPADINALFNYVSQNPTAFGFTAQSVLGSYPACNATVTSGIVCTPGALVSPNAEQTHLWVDGVHLTTAGQTIETGYIYSLLTAPSQISLLAESVVQGGLARAATIQGQIDLSAQHRGPTRVNVWASAGVSSLSFRNRPNFPNDSGTPFGGTVGTDYQMPGGVILGMAATAGSQTQNFSTGGHFDQVDEALSLYAAYRTGPWWGNAVASYGLLQDHVARQVTLGNFIDQNSANTSGQSVALALRGGRDFHLESVTTGPVVGLVLQHAHINGFTETGGSGVTALSFGGQSRDSFVSQLGWRGSAELGKWQPFAEVAWNHDWAGKSGMIVASLTSIAAPSYSAAAFPAATDWASASLGTAYKFNERVMLRGALSAVFINPRASSYGGEVGLNVSF
jgi:outer membrane lipase/esterase